ncbi:MAG: aminotransferase class III-fold pyridoxal phosphate-dependent enzyme [Oscillospiraceae bacterium]|nr:aminotransferase class III-fold pyridoxal phosphate-dependent enzyme [Oscillospiraceae bacterium]
MFDSPCMALGDLLGESYVKAVAAASAAMGGAISGDAFDAVDFCPIENQNRNDALLKLVGQQVCPPFEEMQAGAGTDSFGRAFCASAAPLTGFGCFRVGEDGRLYFLGKSEHYHAPLGHRFCGYGLIDKARKLGIVNPTHNNTRGYVTRLTEKKLTEATNEKSLDRVINLETGSLAVEAGIKMMLNRFYRLEGFFGEPKYRGKIPVFFVMADQNGGLGANYHGTTVLAQTFRGLWPGFRESAENSGLYKTVPVKINDIGDFKAKICEYNKGEYKTAGFLHEIILMNYGATRLSREYLSAAYELCRETDTPALVDEIQSCMWFEGMFLFRQYGLVPDFVVLGKGFPGGEYPASKIITNAKMDTLSQFGALVTNGQEELASLSYLVTMAFVSANGREIFRLGEYFQARLGEICRKNPHMLTKTEGLGHLAALHFKSVEQAAEFAGKLNARYIDASAQLYKRDCPPAVLLKPPIISSEAAMDFIADTIEELM